MASFADPLERKLLRTAMRAPLLAADDEQALARRWRQSGDDAALHELTGAYMRLVVSMAGRFRRYGLPMADLVQEGAVGLMQAAERFDPERGVRFSTYAGWWVRAAMQDFVLRNWSIVRTGTTSAGKALFFNLRRLRARLGDLDGRLSPEARATIAEEMGLDPEDVEAMAARMASGDRSLNAPVSGDADEDWQGLLVDEGEGPEAAAGAAIDGERRRALMTEALSRLSERERRIVVERRLTDEPRTLEDIGAEIGVSKERVRQIEAIALGRMRSWIQAQVGDPVAAGLVG
jgi:RNA polymerase sigma-32 factor